MTDDPIKRLQTGLTRLTNVVPFGKYKGQPVEVMRADQDYFNWAYAQEGIRHRHSWIFNVQLGESSHTPEHNRYQVLFLEQDYADDVFDILMPGLRIRAVRSGRKNDFYAVENYYELAREVDQLCSLTKRGNWNPYDNLSPEVQTMYRNEREEWEREDKQKRQEVKVKLGVAEARLSDVDRRCDLEVARSIEFSELAEVKVEFEAKALRFGGPADVQLTCLSTVIRIEIKPQMGDDYPAVLRQMKDNECGVLYLVNYDGGGATLDQVIEVFRRSGITVLEHVED